MKKKEVSATMTTTVAVDIATAFDAFVSDIDLWWRRGPRFRPGGDRAGKMVLEPRVGGRLMEVYDEAKDDRFVAGRVLAWEPNRCMIFEWRLSNFAADEATEVEVTFEPTDDGKTRVVVCHRGWHDLPKGHPALHGEDGFVLGKRIGMWWASLFLAYVDIAGAKRRA